MRHRPHLTTRSETLAFRVWAHAKPLGWDCTIAEIADAIDEDMERIRRVCQLKGWGRRFRVQRRRVDLDLTEGDDDAVSMIPMVSENAALPMGFRHDA